MIDLITSAEKFYQINPREYHDYNHARDVVQRLHELLDTPTNSLVLGAWWHDAIYFPGAPESVNERASAAALMSTHRLIKAKVSDQDVATACEIIIGTRLSIHLGAEEQHGELAFLLDADLGGMAAPYPLFKRSQERIILENFAALTPESYHKSATFSKMMLVCRNHLFHTPKGRDLWEAAAVANIEQYCKEHL